MVTIEQVKELRDATGISIMQCKKALEEAGGDKEKALLILKKKGGDMAAQKAERVLKTGTVVAYIHSNGNVGAMVELSCETDFVAKNQDFKSLAYDIAMHIVASNPEYLKKEDITKAVKESVVEIFEGEVKNKPEALREKILQGKIDAYFKERILLEQLFVKNQDISISNLIVSAIQKFGENIEIRRFIRFSVTEK